MARSMTQNFTCPCGKVIHYHQYEHVNVADNAQLRYIVLAGLLNVVTCLNCGRQAEFPTPFIYSDPAYHVLAYVHPNADLPDEARLLILEKLRITYKEIVTQQNDMPEHRQTREAQMSPSTLPPLRVTFGLEQFNEMLNSVLSPEEKLGKLALHTQSRSEAERGQFLDITRKLATEMDCVIDVEDLPDEYTVWLYGARRQIGALMRALASRG